MSTYVAPLSDSENASADPPKQPVVSTMFFIR